MSSVDYQRIRDIFSAARKLRGPDRERLLANSCAGEPGLRAEVESLLANLEGSTGRARILDEPALGSAGSAVLRGLAEAAEGAAAIPERIGQYRIVRLIGEGAMGAVYEAEQESPRRRVALKVLRSGLLSRQVMQRFGREAEILAKLHHPAIAQVFEAGTFGPPNRPQPFFAMEFIQGAPLSRYAADHRLSVRDRLALVARICDAVQHAHERGVIHRDLKPANIMVVEGQTGDAGPRPKVLDFGVARAADPDLRLTTVETGVGQIIGTVAYMSPEQARADAAGVDARTDVYALGVILYELLAERLPYEIGGRMLHDAVRVIQESEPDRLSTTNKVFRGDVETIVAKALEKEKGRRYQTAGELAADLRRYLADEPIVARPATRAYQLKKFARRNKVLVAGIAATMAALLIGTIASTLLYLRADRARRGEAALAIVANKRAEEAAASQHLAEAQSRRFKAINDFLLTKILRSPDPRYQGRDVKVIDLLDGAAKDASASFGSDPSLEADVRETLAKSFDGIGEFDKAFEQVQLAHALRVKTEAPNSDAMMENIVIMAREYGSLDHADKAIALLEDARTTLGPRADSNEYMPLRVSAILGDMLQKDNRPEQAEPILKRVLAAQDQDPKVDPDDHLYTVNILGSCLMAEDKLPEAEVYVRRFYETAKKLWGPEHPSAFLGLTNLAGLLVREKHPAEAEPMLREAVRLTDKIMGHEHVSAGITRANLGKCLADLGRLDEADDVYAQCIQIIRGAVGNVYLTERAMELRYQLLIARGLWDRAEPMIRERLEMRKQQGIDSQETELSVLKDDIKVLARLGRGDEAAAEAQQAIAVAAKLYPAGDPRIDRARSWYGEALIAQHKLADAEPLLLACYQAQDRATGVAKKEAPETAAILAELYRDLGKPDEAGRWSALAKPQAVNRPGG